DGPAVNESLLANQLGRVPHHAGSRVAAPANWFLAPAAPHQVGRSSAVDGAAVPACGTGILVPAWAARDYRTSADLAASLAPGRGDDLAHPLSRSPTRAARSPAQPRPCHDASCTIKKCAGVACTTNIGRMRSPDR